LPKPFKYLLFLLLLTVIMIIFGVLINILLSINLRIIDIICLTLSFSAASLISIIVFLKGQIKDIKSQSFYTLVAISLKFLMVLVIALMWFIVAKKTSISYILLFFVLYLTFTMFLIYMILKTLKTKSL
jgi:uncharacterized membrane protein